MLDGARATDPERPLPRPTPVVPLEGEPMPDELDMSAEAGPPATPDTVLRLQGVTKSYGSTQALIGVDLTLQRGSVHGLVGENGAGKSTLVKILGGVVRPDAGTVSIDGRPADLSTPAAARAAGISTAFQELTLLPDLTVAENLLLRTAGRWTGSRRRRTRSAAAVLDRWGVGSLDLGASVGSLSLRDRQLVEIVAAVDRPHRVLVLDEPTSSLLPDDTRWLREVTRRLVGQGSAVVFISHMLDEVEDFCDRVSVQRNGAVIATHTSPGLDRGRVVEQMIGRSLDTAYPPRTPAPTEGPAVLVARDLRVGDAVRGMDLEVRPGEVLGVAALDGQGQAELFRALAGDLRPTGGTVELHGAPARLGSPARALRSGADGTRRGIAFVPADRKTSGTLLDLSVRKNISLPVLDRSSRGGVVSDRREQELVSRLMALVQVDPVKIDHPVRSLSGGNQQKVAFARAAASDSAVLVLYDPTRGVDVGTKYELYKLIHELAAAGTAVLYYSTEIPEVVNVCHRALVCYAGRIVHEVPGERLSEEELMSAAIGLETVREDALP